MFAPVGPRPSAVYWRRRVVFVASLALVLVLIVLTVDALRSSGGGSPAAGAPAPGTSTAAAGSHSAAAPSTIARSSSASSARRSGTNRRHAPAASRTSASASTTASLESCDPGSLALSAVTDKPQYSVGARPTVGVEVVNRGSQPCVQDLADRQVELRVYNGESRVWGSHDCQNQPGTSNRTLMPGVPVKVTMAWSGMTSQPKCAGTRQRVGAGSYTLYALLAGHTGRAARFAIS